MCWLCVILNMHMCVSSVRCVPPLVLQWGRYGKDWVPRTYAGGNGRAALLVAFSTAVARDTSHAVFTGTLSCGLVTGFASSTHGMAITCCEETEEEREAQWVVTHKHTHTCEEIQTHTTYRESAGGYTAVEATIIEWWETGGGVHRETELTTALILKWV